MINDTFVVFLYFSQFTGSQESILHLDLDDNGLNSSDSQDVRDVDSPFNVPRSHRSHRHHPITVATTQVDEQPSVSSSSSLAPQQNTGLIRKPSLISLVENV